MIIGNWRKRVAAGLLGTAAVVSLIGNVAFAADWSERPPGGRQIEFKGKLWPPFPRPTGKEAKCLHQYHYAHYWPYPHSCEDISSVRAALNVQASNGWVEATTLFNHHFNADTNQLNSAGIAHLEYVLFRVPGQYRSAFVQMTNSPQSDQMRVANVQAAASSLLNDSNLPPIALRRARSYGTSAAEVDMISRQYMSSTPVPRLGTTSATGGGGASASSSSGASQD